LNLSAKLGLAVNATAQPLSPGKENGYPILRRFNGPRAGMDECGKTSPHRNSIP